VRLTGHHMDFTDISVLSVIDLLGIFVFALSGSWLATRKDLDLVGIVVLGYVTGLAGGVTRDVLIGDLPPLAMVREVYLMVPALAALMVLALPRLVMRFGRPVMVLDAIGLGLFATLGAAKATEFGLGLWAATLVGVVSAVGGGILRDLLAGERRRPPLGGLLHDCEPVCKPDSVEDGHPSGPDRYRPALAAYPGLDRRATVVPAWPCSGWGLPSHRGHPRRWWALTPPFHPCLCPEAIGGLLSVALSVGSPRLGVTQHPALWSPDFPRSFDRDHPTGSHV
jgi:hypothetical protein